jgi:Ca2+-transporting ATPase
MLFSNQKNRSSNFSGTLVASGLCLPSNHNWPNTEVGKLGSSLQNIKETPTPLQIQIQKRK